MRWSGAAGVGLGGVLAGLALGWWLWRPVTVVEQPAPAARQGDGSLILERAQNPSARPAHRIPQGATLERVARVDVVPTGRVVIARDSSAGRSIAPSDTVPRVPSVPRETVSGTCQCDTVRVDLSLVRLGDGSRRVIASARGGEIVGGIDVPVSAGPVVRPMRWAVGASYDPHAKRWGAVLDGDVSVPFPLRVGLTVQPDARTTTLQLRASVRF